jgi:hypothetical protein
VSAPLQDATDYDRFAEVYSVSDVHLSEAGGVDPCATKVLAATILALAARKVDGPRALVLNGDIVDFLDLQSPTVFDPSGAPAKLERVFSDNRAVWDALAQFAAQHTLVLAIGNHDLELALPHCQAMLRRRVTGQLVFALDGAGYRCQVGSTNALFVHGNNEDAWNFVDYDRLRRIGAGLNAGAPLERWEPNEGTRLVIELLNAQKAEHPFIEYLKPEGSWLLGLFARLGMAAQLSQYW